MSPFGLADIVLRPRTAWGRDAERIAVVMGDQELTYRDLSERVLRLAAGLHARGFRRGDTVAVLLKNRPEYFEVVFAVAHLGGVVVPLNYLLRAAEVEFIVGDSEARWMFSEASLLEGVSRVPASPAGPQRIMLDDPAHDLPYEDLLQEDPALAPAESAMSDETVLLQYTSGTTGFPKGAIHTHGTVLFNALAQIVDFGTTAADVHVVVPSLSWAAGLHCLTLSTLWRGGTIVLQATGGFDADAFCALIERHGVTSGMFAPSVLRLVLASGALERHDVSSLRVVLSGGEPVSAAEIAEVQQRVPGVALNQGYGVSEFPSTMLFLGAENVAQHSGAAGLSSVTANVRVLDDGGGDTEPGVHGEISVRSPQSSIGYHGKQGASSGIVDGWLRTGDRGFVDEAGFVHVAGRVKEMIVSGGLNVYPAEVERVLSSHPAVLEAAVVGVADPRFGEVGHAFVVLKEGATLAEGDLEQLAREELAGFKVPRHWTIRADSLPRTVTGKLRRFELS